MTGLEITSRVILHSEFPYSNISWLLAGWNSSIRMWMETGCYSPSTASKSNLNIQSVIHTFRLLKIRSCDSGTFPSAHTLGHGVAGQTENDGSWGERWSRSFGHGSHQAQCLSSHAVMVCSGVGIHFGLLWALESCMTTPGGAQSSSCEPCTSLNPSFPGSWVWCCIGIGMIVPEMSRIATCLYFHVSMGVRILSIPDDQDQSWYGDAPGHTEPTWIHSLPEHRCHYRSWSQIHFSWVLAVIIVSLVSCHPGLRKS